MGQHRVEVYAVLIARKSKRLPTSSIQQFSGSMLPRLWTSAAASLVGWIEMGKVPKSMMQPLLLTVANRTSSVSSSPPSSACTASSCAYAVGQVGFLRWSLSRASGG
eukprot:3935926-Rhodomonas_salina.2